jgi:diacylglycerol kinase family enzyme
MRTLIIINPHSAGGRSQRIFKKIEERLFDAFGEIMIAVTHRPQEVAGHLDTAAKTGVSSRERERHLKHPCSSTG